MISRWKQELLSRASEVFNKAPSEAEKELEKELKHVAELGCKISQLTYEVDWLKKIYRNYHQTQTNKSVIEIGNKHISVKRQAELLQVNRNSVYRKPAARTISDKELFIMLLRIN